MLKLQNIVKIYDTGIAQVQALKGISIEFRRNEFVSILGPSGCGKTTLLNIIGGLDRYTDGDLIINGKSTKDFTDSDWDTYRNHSVGFVFQSYNLIPHQTALANVELALTLSGVSKAERRRRAIEVLNEVGLGDQLHKKPNQMSGGQMQRVAIARALINNPDILLADEPTGALDSETSKQVLEILKKVAKDRLVIMVTHNAELAEAYSTRIVRLHDGQIISDSSPYNSAEEAQDAAAKRKVRQPSMSFGTALSLSLNNLLTKKARTLLTAFAGSIGIIGIALILSLSSGFRNYIADVEEEMLASYPITIERETIDATDFSSFADIHAGRNETREPDAIYVDAGMTESMNMRASQIRRNDLAAFKRYLEENEAEIADYLTGITYGYDVNFKVYAPDTPYGVLQVHPSTLFDELGLTALMEMNPSSSAMMSMSGMNVWTELVDNADYLAKQYELVAGRWPESMDELVLIVDGNNEITDVALYSLGLADPREAAQNMRALSAGQQVELPTQKYSFDEILSLRYRLLLATDHYARDEATGVWVDMSHDVDFMQAALSNAIELKIIGILRPAEGASDMMPGGSVGYSPALIDYVVDGTLQSAIVQEQLANPEINVFSGKPFGQAMTVGTPTDMISSGFSGLPFANMSSDSATDFASLMAMYGMQQLLSNVSVVPADSYDEVLELLGVVDRANPNSVRLYTKDFQSRAAITDFIENYNEMQVAAGNSESVITYTDFIRLILSSVTTIVDSISYVLIAFVAISLVVSSIMIGIITYISVLERTKEIGILRSIGASKRDIGRVFNAETLIIGFAAGTLGVVVTVLLCIPINLIIEALSGISNVAGLPVQAAIVLIIISMFLTLIAGVIPSRIAARKDPVAALRTE